MACPWPYPEAKVYDPQGFYEENGAEGAVLRRYLVHLDERPARRPARRRARATSDRCAPESREWLRPRSVVITGASRGLGFASATQLYRRGGGWSRRCGRPTQAWSCCARRPGPDADDPRLIGVQLDLTDSASVAAAAKVDRGGRRRPVRTGAQRRHLRRRNGRGNADELVGEDVRHTSCSGRWR